MRGRRTRFRPACSSSHSKHIFVFHDHHHQSHLPCLVLSPNVKTIHLIPPLSPKMGTLFSCLDQVPDLQRLQYDLSPLKSNPLPVVWFLGPPGSGRHSHSWSLSEKLGFENVLVAELLKQEGRRETDRGRIVREALEAPFRRVPDTIVVDLIKEAMLQKYKHTRGFILNGFPRSSRQAQIFVKEVGDVDVIVYLFCEADVMAKRVLDKNGGRLDPEAVRRDVNNYIKEVKEGVSKFGAKIEKIHTGGPPGEVFGRLEAAVAVRLNRKPSPVMGSEFRMQPEV